MAAPTYVREYQPNALAMMSGVESAIAQANTMARVNSARSSMMAREQREWQEAQNAKAMEFNAAEAEKSRNWQEYMSNTAHQREIADLKAAGLNPVLSAMGGNGAAVTSGAQAQGVTSAGAKGEVDTSANQAIVNLLGSMLNYVGNIEVANTNARTAERNADLMAQVNEFVALIGAEASKYGADQQYSIQKSREAHDQFMASNYPQSFAGYAGPVSDILDDLFGSKGVHNFFGNAADGAAAAGAWLKRVFVDESTFKRIYASLSGKMRDKFASGYYDGKR